MRHPQLDFHSPTHERIYETSGARSLHLEILLGASAVISPCRVSAGSLTFADRHFRYLTRTRSYSLPSDPSP